MNSEGGVRGGTCIAEQNSFCAIVDRATYVKIIRKLNQEKMSRITRFLRQIEFIRYWTVKEVLSFNYLLKLRIVKAPGYIIINEKTNCSQVVIVQTGELEVVLKNSSNLYMNQNSGIVQLNYDDGSFVKSGPVTTRQEAKPTIES